MPMIVTNDLTKRYGALVAVDGLNLAINEGEIFGLLGPNGAGKTTSLMMLSSLLKPTAGRASVNGFDVASQAAEVRASIGMVFQDPSSDPILSAYDNLKLHALLYNVPLKEIDARITAVLSLVELEKRAHDKVKTFSGGMRRRMEIARGLLHEPRVLFLDEPTLGLDPQTREYIWQYIQSLAERNKMTIVLTTHYMEEAEKLCGRIAIIDHGKIAALDTPENLVRSVGGDIVLLKGDIAVDALRALLFVKEISADGRGYRLSVENAARNLPQLLQSAGAVTCVEVHSPDLNDVFLQYTGRAMRDQEDGGSPFLRDIVRVREGK